MLENNLPSWRQDLNSSRRKEGESPSNRWVQLATVNDKNNAYLSIYTYLPKNYFCWFRVYLR